MIRNTLKLTWCFKAAALFLAVALASPVQADIIELNPDGSDSINLAAVLDGDNIVRVGDKDFDFRVPTFQASGGAVAPTSSSIDLFGSQNPAGDFGLKFQLNGFNVASGQSVDGLLEFTVTANDPNLVINDVEMIMQGGASAGTGVATIVEGVQFAQNGAPALEENLFVADTPGFNQLQDAAFLISPSKSIFVSKDIGVSGGTNGSAQISAFTQHFSQIPEPATAALFALGGLVMIRRRRH